MESVASPSLVELAMNLLAIVIVGMIALSLWRVLKRILGGCVSAGVGCLVLVVGVVAVVLFFASKSDITSVNDGLRLLGQ